MDSRCAQRLSRGGDGRAVLRSATYLSIIPGLALVATVLGVYLSAEGVVEALAKREGHA